MKGLFPCILCEREREKRRMLWNRWNANYSAGKSKEAVEIPSFGSTQLVCLGVSHFSPRLFHLLRTGCCVIIDKKWFALANFCCDQSSVTGRSAVSFWKRCIIRPSARGLLNSQSKHNAAAVLNCPLTVGSRLTERLRGKECCNRCHRPVPLPFPQPSVH